MLPVKYMFCIIEMKEKYICSCAKAVFLIKSKQSVFLIPSTAMTYKMSIATTLESCYYLCYTSTAMLEEHPSGGSAYARMGLQFMAGKRLGPGHKGLFKSCFINSVKPPVVWSGPCCRLCILLTVNPSSPMTPAFLLCLEGCSPFAAASGLCHCWISHSKFSLAILFSGRFFD